MRIFSLVVFLFGFLACSQSRLKIDPSLPAGEANYQTAEFWACGEHWHGLGVCRLDPSNRMDAIDLKIQGYYRGTIRIFSINSTDQCDYDETLTYSGNDPISISIPGTVGEGCTIGFSISPEYPGQNNQDIVIRSFIGFLRIRGVETKTLWSGGFVRVIEGNSESFSVPTPDSGMVPVEIRGCGISYGESLQVQDGKISFSLRALGLIPRIQTCVLEGVLLGRIQVVFTELVSSFSSRFVPLAIPSITTGNNRMLVEADPTVSIISLDSIYSVGSWWKTKFDSRLPHTLRILTVAGRSVVGDYDPKLMDWSWK